MKNLVAALLVVVSFSSQASGVETECQRRNKGEPGYNCTLPEDATGRPIFYSERVVGRVIWVSSTKNAHGLYEFSAEYEYFQVDGHSRFRPIIGEKVEIVVRAVLYAGRITRDK